VDEGLQQCSGKAVLPMTMFEKTLPKPFASQYSASNTCHQA
jgi:hypothetical protein